MGLGDENLGGGGRGAYEGVRVGGAAVWDVMGNPSKPLWKTAGGAKAGTKV